MSTEAIHDYDIEEDLKELPTKTVGDLTVHLHAMSRIDAELDTLQQTCKELRVFYEARKAKLQERLAYHEGALQGWLNAHQLRRLALPRCTIYLGTTQTPLWPSEDIIKDWLQSKGEEWTQFIVTKSHINYLGLREKLSKSDESLPGYEVVSRTKLIRKTTNVPDPVSDQGLCEQPTAIFRLSDPDLPQ